MDGQRHGYVPGSLLGRLRHGAAAGGGRWRKLPPEAGAVAVADTGVNSDADPEPDSGTVAKCNAGTVADAQRVSNGHADTESVAQRDGNPVAVGHTDTEGNAFGDCAGRLPDPHAGSGGRVAPIPAAAQAARWDTGSHWHCR